MTAPLPARDMWQLIDSVRDRSYDLFTFAEKQKMHDLVVAFKAKGVVSPEDMRRLPRARRRARA